MSCASLVLQVALARNLTDVRSICIARVAIRRRRWCDAASAGCST
jgi:hypothetical protein